MTEAHDQPLRSALATLHAVAEDGDRAWRELHAAINRLSDAHPDDTEGPTPCATTG